MTGPPDFLALSDADLLRECEVDTFRASGPGGQHRNKTDSAVRLRHRPTGLSGQAVESRSQGENRATALRRLRQTIALEVQRPLDLAAYAPPPAVAGLFVRNGPARTGKRSAAYWPAIQALLDLFVAGDGSVSETAERLGVSTGRLSRFLLSEAALARKINALRAERGLRPLR